MLCFCLGPALRFLKGDSFSESSIFFCILGTFQGLASQALKNVVSLEMTCRK